MTEPFARQTPKSVAATPASPLCIRTSSPKRGDAGVAATTKPVNQLKVTKTQSHKNNSFVSSCLCVFVSLLFSALALAQQNNPSSLFARDSSEGVYVRDSAVASEKMALAYRLEHLQEWSKAADIYQELLQQYSDRVTPSDAHDDHIYQYTSVALAVQGKLAKWPQDGLDAYRNRYESDAASLLQQAGNAPLELHKIVSQYFITDSARDAAIQLIDTDLESADFAAAAWMADRLLALHPNLGDQRPMLLYRAALAYRLAGSEALAEQRAKELRRDFPTATGAIQGKQVVLADSLDAQIKLAHSAAENIRTDSWPMAFGSLDRSLVPAVAGFGGAKLFSIKLSEENLKAIPDPNLRNQAKQLNHVAREAGNMTGVMPVVDRGELFFQDNARVYAVSLDSGLPLPGWASTYDGDPQGSYAITAWVTPQNTQYTLALTDDSVLGIMGQIDGASLQNGMNPNARDTRLVCLDRKTGKEKWVIRPAQLPGDNLHQLDFNGTPLVVNDNLFITGHSNVGMQFEDCYLLCFDLAGHFKFATYIASANSGAAVFAGDPESLNQQAPQLAYSSGRVFVLSNLGALAAVDAYDGTIVWLNLYPRQANNEFVRQFGFRGGWGRVTAQPENQRPFTSSPIIISDGKVFVFPTDGQFLLAYDAGTGAEVKRIKPTDLYDTDTLVGVIGDRMVLLGVSDQGQNEQTHALCLNWKNYEMANFDPDKSDAVSWRAHFPVGLRGRGFLTTNALYVPTEKKLFQVNLQSGMLDSQYPEGQRDWDESESSGNLLVTQDHLIVAGPERVNVYTDLNLAMAKLDKEVAAAPTDPAARLRYAEVMFVAGKFDIAVAKLDEAIKVIGGLEHPTDDSARDRIFASAMAFAEKLARDKTDVSDALATTLYDRAAQAAANPQQQVNYRISRAHFAAEHQDDARELTLLQEIVANPDWRSVPVVQSDASGPALAAAAAEKMIGELIQRSPQVYAPVQQQADAAFTSAQTAADPAKLLAVAQTYPNSTIAPQALMKAADAYESVGNPRQAVQILRQLYFKYPQSPNRALVVESLARNYLATPNHIDVAIARLAQGAKLPNNPTLTRPLVLPDGTTIKDLSFADALTALRKYHDQAAARSLPDFGLPAPANLRTGKAFVRVAEPIATHIDSIVKALPDFARSDRIVTFTTAADLAVFPADSSTPIFSSKALADRPVGCAWVGETLLVWSAGKMVMFKPDGSGTLWESDLHNIPQVEVATRDEGENANTDDDTPPDNLPPNVINNGGQIVILPGGRMFRRGPFPGFGRRFVGQPVDANPSPGAEQIWKVNLVSDRVILATSSGRILALDLADGKNLWQIRPSDRPADRLLASDDFVVALINEGQQIRVIALDTFSGQSLMHREFPAGGLINLALATDGKLLYLLADRIECKDLFEPGEHLSFSEQVRRTDGNGAFNGAIQPEQFIISDGRVIAVSDDGRFLRAYALEDGKPLLPAGNDADGVDTSMGLQTKSPDWQVRLIAQGSRLYAVGARSLVQYNLDQIEDTWDGGPFPDDTVNDSIFGKDYLLLVNEHAPTDRPQIRQQFPTTLALCAFSRALVSSGRESGLLAARFTFTNPTGIQSWQPIDGGIAYLSGDQKLLLLKGAAK
jgi:outer membrane protein assembly factor BamB/outer membrane protein assembly factor BamD (BamD/ComL family)